MSTSETSQLLSLLAKAAAREGVGGIWVELIEDALYQRTQEPAVALRPADLSEGLLAQAVRAEQATTDFERSALVDSMVRHLLVSFCLSDKPAPRQPEIEEIEGETWTVLDVMEARFYCWRDWGAWQDYFMGEIQSLALPYVIWQKLHTLIVGSFDPQMIRGAATSAQKTFLHHFWRGDRFVEFPEWAQFVQGYDNLSIEGLGPSRTRALQQALREYTEKRRSY